MQEGAVAHLCIGVTGIALGAINPYMTGMVNSVSAGSGTQAASDYTGKWLGVDILERKYIHAITESVVIVGSGDAGRLTTTYLFGASPGQSE